MRKLQKPLPCPGNIVGGAKRHSTTLPGMEALFSIFHIGAVGVGVAGGCFRRWFGIWCCHGHVCGVDIVLLREFRHKTKKPCK